VSKNANKEDVSSCRRDTEIRANLISRSLAPVREPPSQSDFIAKVLTEQSGTEIFWGKNRLVNTGCDFPAEIPASEDHLSCQ
jgi:hypothetical protein